MIQEGGPRTNATSAWQSRGQKGGPAIKSNVLDSSTGKDKYQEGIRQWESKKYLRERCCHSIEYSIANSLVALMWRWYLKIDIQPYNYL